VTVREPPRGYTDPPGTPTPERAGIVTTWRLLLGKPSFWYMAAATSIVAMVGYGYSAFQAPMMQRLHGLSPAEFAVRFGVPLSIMGAIGTLAAGYITEQMAKRSVRWVARLPAIFLAAATPLYLLGFIQPTSELDRVFILWALAFMLHYSYLGAQYTIGQGVVPQTSRASAIAILLFIIALVGNGIGPQIVGVLSDTFMTLGLEQRGLAGVLDVAACNPKLAAALPAAQQAACSAIYAEGLRNSMMVTALLLLVAAACFWMSSRHLYRDMLVR